MSESLSCAVTESTFEELKESKTITVMDWYGMGNMSEFDVFVSLSIDLAGNGDNSGEM